MIEVRGGIYLGWDGVYIRDEGWETPQSPSPAPRINANEDMFPAHPIGMLMVREKWVRGGNDLLEWSQEGGWDEVGLAGPATS